MPTIVELPDDLAEALNGEASRLGLSLPDYALRLLISTRPATDIRTGADLVQFWRDENLLGSRPEISDSQEEARNLRAEAERRRA